MKLKRSVLADICEVFQDLVDKKGIEIPNRHKPDDAGDKTIYGEDWDFLLDGVEEVLSRVGVSFTQGYSEDIKEEKVYVVLGEESVSALEDEHWPWVESVYEFRFKTIAEVAAFVQGVNITDGWLDGVVMDDNQVEEYNKYLEKRRTSDD